MIESTAGEPMKLEEDPASQQYELKLYDQWCEAGVVHHCNLCRNITRRRFPYTLNAEDSLFQASARECSVCAALCDSLAGIRSSLQVQWNSLDFRFNACSKTPRFYASEVTLKDTYRYTQFQLFTELCQPGPEPIIGAARSIAAESNSSQCFDLIRHWISECAQHPACGPASFSTRLPTRLLDILAGDGGIKLYETHEEEKDVYIALSHCWGPQGLPDEAKTTNATKEDRKRGIRIEALPKSFQDAITICHALGIRYLWIDSLCIIQQDKDDWEKECSRMRDVYRNSYLTISVARSRDSSEGCFSSRPTKHLSTKVGSINHQGQVYDIMARESIKHYQIVGSDSHSSDFPLFSRAWTFQERLLPQRVVHYGETELIWECNSLCDCECAASREFLAPWDWEKSPKVMFAKMMNRPRKGPEFRRDWAALMRRFSLMQLSFDADRLPSLSGLVQDLECSDTGRYLAGLWERELPWMIGWMSMGKDACRPSSTPKPPSWSWTSVENIWVSWNYSADLSGHDEWTTMWPNGRDLTENNDAFRIVQCTVESKDYTTLGDHDVFGRVSSGTLIVSGRLVYAVLRDDFFCERNTIKQRFSPDVRGEPGLYIAGRPVYCLMIGAMSTESSKYPGLVTVSSLILRLREKDGEGRCTYERIGLMSQNNHFAWKETSSWWEDAESAVVEIT